MVSHSQIVIFFSVHTACVFFLPVRCSFFGVFNIFSDSTNDFKKAWREPSGLNKIPLRTLIVQR